MKKQLYLGTLLGLLIVGSSTPAAAESPEIENEASLEIARGCDYLDIKADETLEKGDSLECSGYRLTLQQDGNLVLYAPNGNPLWATGSKQGTKFLVQQDGNVVLYQGDKALFATDTDGNPGAYLRLQSDGNLVLYSSNGNPLWATNTEGGRRVHTDATIQWQNRNRSAASGIPNEAKPNYFRGKAEYTSDNNPFYRDYAPRSIGGTNNFKNPDSHGNCTWYAYGRALELGGNRNNMRGMTGNAAEWSGITISRNDLQVGDIIQWPNVYSPYGHVAVVEKVNGDGSVVVSDSGYHDNTSESWLHQVRTIPASGGNSIHSLDHANFFRVQ